MKTSLYFQPGDLLFFAGRGWESRFIAGVTCSLWQMLRGQFISHVGICATYDRKVLLFESTTLTDLPCAIQQKAVSGSQAHEPNHRIDKYDGKVWRLRLNERDKLKERDSHRLSTYLSSTIGRPYDYAGAPLSGTKIIRLVRGLYQDTDILFCSEWCTAALKDVGKMNHDVNASTYSPARLARDLQYWGTYQPLGKKNSESVRVK